MLTKEKIIQTNYVTYRIHTSSIDKIMNRGLDY